MGYLSLLSLADNVVPRQMRAPHPAPVPIVLVNISCDPSKPVLGLDGVHVVTPETGYLFYRLGDLGPATIRAFDTYLVPCLHPFNPLLRDQYISLCMILHSPLFQEPLNSIP